MLPASFSTASSLFSCLIILAPSIALLLISGFYTARLTCRVSSLTYSSKVPSAIAGGW
ncbi:hypothetical protein OROMI_003859 [Orobanche minor]